MEESSEDKELDLVDDECIWKKNCRMFYCILLSQTLDWPSLTVEWLDYRGDEIKQGYVTHRIAYGSYTSGQEPEKLLIDSVGVPNDNISKEEIETIIRNNKIFTRMAPIDHQGESHKIRRNLKNMFIVASLSSNGKIYVYDYSKCSKNLDKGLISVLTGNEKDGFGLSWNPFDGGENLIASGCYDRSVRYWDYLSANSDQFLHPVHSYNLHSDGVEDLTWTSVNSMISVSGDRLMYQMDIRDNSAVKYTSGHEGCINSIDLCQNSKMQILTSSSDSTVKLWDLRDLSTPIKSISHTGEVYCSKFSPFSDGIFASSTSENKIHVFDIDRGKLIFTHEGHFSRISDFSWNLNEPFLIASVDEDNKLQVWCMNTSYLNY